MVLITPLSNQVVDVLSRILQESLRLQRSQKWVIECSAGSVLFVHPDFRKKVCTDHLPGR
jgi:hypothetical protein